MEPGIIEPSSDEIFSHVDKQDREKELLFSKVIMIEKQYLKYLVSGIIYCSYIYFNLLSFIHSY